MHLTSRPAWTFAQKYSSKLDSRAPGPGAYSPKAGNYEQPPQYRIGTSNRYDFTGKSAEAPGPGAYNPEKKEHSPAPKMGTSKRDPLSETLANPGPGTYQIPSKVQEGPQYSIQRKYSSKGLGDNPGPGYYEQDLNDFTTKERPISARIGTAQRDNYMTKHAAEYPGPGSYDNRPQSAAPKWGFGSEARNKNSNTDDPGPGTYEMGGTLNPKGWSISGKYPDGVGTEKLKVPGPGAYSPEGQGKMPSYTIGRSGRSDFTKGGEKQPGPGAYEHTLRPSSSGPKLGTGKRQPLSQSENTPGPGTYEFRNTNEGPQFSMPGRSGKGDRPKTPGPGAYNPGGSMTDRASPSYRIGSARRDDDKPDTVRNQFPGPGSYSGRPQTAGPKWGFGTEKRDKRGGSTEIGPGQYEMRSSLDQKAWSMSGRHPNLEEKNLGEFPGPGAYNPQPNYGAPNYGFGTSRRPQSGNAGSPGPGAYNVGKDFNKTAPLFGTGKRQPLSNVTDTPGPGGYNVKSGRDGPAYSMSAKTLKNAAHTTPGPGSYNPNTGASNPSWSVGKDKRNEIHSLSKSQSAVGPGLYDIRGKLGGPKWGFGSSQRNGKQRSDSPGPGNYELHSSIGNLPNYAKAGR